MEAEHQKKQEELLWAQIIFKFLQNQHPSTHSILNHFTCTVVIIVEESLSLAYLLCLRCEIEELRRTVLTIEKEKVEIAVNAEATGLRGVTEGNSELLEKISGLEYELGCKKRALEEREGRIKDLETEMSALQEEEVQVVRGRGGRRAARAGVARGGATRGARGGVSNARAQRQLETQMSTLKSRNDTLNTTVSNLEKDVSDLKKALRTAESEAKKAKESGGSNPKDTKKLEVWIDFPSSLFSKAPAPTFFRP